MPNTGGSNGTVSSCVKSDTAGRSVTVHYPAPPPGKDETYEVDAEEYATFLAAFSGNTKVDVTAPDASGNGVTGVTAKR